MATREQRKYLGAARAVPMGYNAHIAAYAAQHVMNRGIERNAQIGLQPYESSCVYEVHEFAAGRPMIFAIVRTRFRDAR